MRKLIYAIRIVQNIWRKPIYKIISLNRVNIQLTSLIEHKVKLYCSYKGKIDLGKKIVLEQNCLLRSTAGIIKVNDGVYINRNCNIVSRESIIIGKNVSIGPNVCIYDHDHNFKNNNSLYVTAPIIIEDNVWIGSNVTILKGVKIGENSVIAAGTVVKETIESNTLFYPEIKYKKKGI